MVYALRSRSRQRQQKEDVVVESGSESESASEVEASATPQEPKKKNRCASWNVRFYTTWSMLAFFCVVMYLGHITLVSLVFLVQVAMFNEIVNLGVNLNQENHLPGSRALYWYWFLCVAFFNYGRQANQLVGLHVPYHSFLSYVMVALGVVLFVLSLKKGHYRYQFKMFAWCGLTLLLVVVQSSFLVSNIYQGIIWFVLPALMVISNDTWAYVCGISCGRTPLIELSPKKTWEGFVGAAIITIFTGFWISRVLSMFQFMTCPQEQITWAHPECEPHAAFVPVQTALPSAVSSLVSAVGLGELTFVSIAPIQWHGMVFGMFASLIGPFGGFFASGFKRAFDYKDFGSSIPGHGGFTDRMDCQLMMGVFAYVYYWNFVQAAGSAQAVWGSVSGLPPEQQLDLFAKLKDSLITQGLLQ